MVPIALLLLIVLVAVALGFGSVRRHGQIDWAAAARRLYLYGIALVALGMLVSGLAGLLELLLATVVEALGPVSAGSGGDALRERLSFTGALTAIGLVAWVAHWWLADRPVRRGDRVERGSAVRKLFLYIVLLVGGAMLTMAGRELVSDLVQLAFGVATRTDLLAGAVVGPLALLGVAAVFWLYYTRRATDDRERQPERDEAATLRRWFTYGLCFLGLMLLLFGAAGMLDALWDSAIARTRGTMAEDRWLATAVAGRIGSIAAGLVTWYLAWTWSLRWLARPDDVDPERRSALRRVYLYLALAVAVGWTVWNLGLILYGLLRTILVPTTTESGWTPVLRELGGPLAAVVVFGVAWLYHARVARREAGDAAERGQAAIRWIYGYLVALVGVLTLSVGLVGTLATLIDLILQPTASRPSYWWQDQVSLYATLIAVGLPVWLVPWSRLQREAAEAAAARQALARRIYLLLSFGIAVLSLLGSGAFVLYQLLRLALGERWTAGQTGDLAWALSAAAVAGVMLAYHFRVFRAGLTAAGEDARPEPAATSVTLAVVRGATPEQLAELRQRLVEITPAGVNIELLDHSSGVLSGSRAPDHAT